MANPQKENGYIPIANIIAEHLAYYRLSGEEYQVLWVVLRKTWGWKKKADFISLSQFQKGTKMKKPNICRALKKLESKNIIIKKDNAIANEYRFNKDFDSWKVLSKKITLSKKIIPIIKKDNKSLSKKIHTKDTSTKDTITKENPIRIFEKYKEIFKGIYEPRKLTPKIESKIKARLKEFKEEELVLALQKIREDDFITGKNPNGKIYCTPEYCFRSDEMIEKWLNQKEGKQNDPYQNAKTY